MSVVAIAAELHRHAVRRVQVGFSPGLLKLSKVGRAC
jgi:hypothetical protein